MTYRCEACGEPLPPKGKGRRRRFCSERCKDLYAVSATSMRPGAPDPMLISWHRRRNPHSPLRRVGYAPKARKKNSKFSDLPASVCQSSITLDDRRRAPSPNPQRLCD